MQPDSTITVRDLRIPRLRFLGLRSGQNRIALSLLALVMMASGGAAQGIPPPASAAPAATAAPAAATSAVTVSIKDFSFSPQILTVAVGTTVTWKNLDDEAHTVRGADAQIRSDALDQGESYSVKFDKPGTYSYGCSLHSKMSGTIVVK